MQVFFLIEDMIYSSKWGRGRSIQGALWGMVQTHPSLPTKCKTCYKNMTDMSKSHACHQPDIIQKYLRENIHFSDETVNDDRVCYACYKSHLIIVKVVNNNTDVDLRLAGIQLDTPIVSVSHHGVYTKTMVSMQNFCYGNMSSLILGMVQIKCTYVLMTQNVKYKVQSILNANVEINYTLCHRSITAMSSPMTWSSHLNGGKTYKMQAKSSKFPF